MEEGSQGGHELYEGSELIDVAMMMRVDLSLVVVMKMVVMVKVDGEATAKMGGGGEGVL